LQIKKITQLIVITFFFSLAMYTNAQEVEINGKVIADDDIEGIHIINKTADKFTITDSNGAFVIPAKLNDTIIVSGIKYKRQEIIVNEMIKRSKEMTVYLEEYVYQLDEVLIGKFLSGDLQADILNTKIKNETNFYDVGIPGYTGRQMTQNERRLYDADYGKSFGILQNSLLNVNVYKILNKISGRTKKLKNIVRLEALNDCTKSVQSEFSEILFGNLEIEEPQILDFFYFASEDPDFLKLCKSKSSMSMYQFLVDKLVNYKENLEEGED